MRFTTSALILLAATFTAPALAGDPKPGAPEEAQEAKEEKQICRRITSPGSRRSERVCMSQEQWKEYNNGN